MSDEQITLHEAASTPREMAELILADLEFRGARFVWRDDQHHDFRCELDLVEDWNGLPEPAMVARLVFKHADDIRMLLRRRAH